MVNQNLISVIQRRIDDATGQLQPASAVVKELEIASAEITSHPTIKRYLLPQVDATLTVTADQDEYTLPTDYNYQIHQVRTNAGASTERQLQYVPYPEIQGIQETGGAPAYYSVRGRKLVLAPMPATADAGATIQVRYSEKDGTYANDGNETILGAKYPHLLIAKTCYQLSLAEQDGEVAAVADRFQNDFKQGMDLAVQELSEDGGGKYVSNTDDYLPI